MVNDRIYRAVKQTEKYVEHVKEEIFVTILCATYMLSYGLLLQ